MRDNGIAALGDRNPLPYNTYGRGMERAMGFRPTPRLSRIE